MSQLHPMRYPQDVRTLDGTPVPHIQTALETATNVFSGCDNAQTHIDV
jgi:hypothetical protein